MSYPLIFIKILLIFSLVQARLYSHKKRWSYGDYCLKESDCDMNGFIDCFCLPPKCWCYYANETRLMALHFNTTGMRYGEKCTTQSSCRYDNCHLISKTCLCYYEFHRENDSCVLGQLGYPCAEVCSTDAFCDASVGYKCSCCPMTYMKPNNSVECHLKVRAGYPCEIDEACGTRALCKDGRCRCNPKEQYHEEGWCNPKKALGGSCKQNNYCIDNVCSDNICVCPYGFEEIHGICTRNLFNITCQADNDCLVKMNYTMCNIQKKLCVCNLKTYQQNGKCIPKKKIGEPCSENIECTYDYCKDFNCKCRYSYYLFGEECTEGKKPGAECYLDEECQALNIHSSCVNRFCQCSRMFHLEKKRYCVPVMGINSSCAFKIKVDTTRILETAQYLSISWYQISKDIEQKTRDIYATKLSEVFVSISAYPGEHEGIIEAYIYFRIIIDDISLKLREILIDQLQLFEPIPFLPEPDDIKINAIEGVCLLTKPLMSFKVKIGIIITTCIFLVTILVTIIIIRLAKANNPKNYIPWVQKEFAKSAYIPPIEDLKKIVEILIEDELLTQNTNKILSYKELQAVYIKYFYYSYYDFDFSYTYDMSYPYENYMNTIEDDFNYDSLFEDFDYMVASNDDYNYISKEEYDKGYNYETIDKDI